MEDGKVSCLCNDVRGSRMREMTMECRRRDLDTWLRCMTERVSPRVGVSRDPKSTGSRKPGK